jgi:hypothetical protein
VALRASISVRASVIEIVIELNSSPKILIQIIRPPLI